MLKSNKNHFPKILFCTATPRIFRTTFIGHLYEISNKFPVVLLSEKLDSDSEKIIKDKKLFPKLEKIIEVGQYTKKMGMLEKNRYLKNLAKEIIYKEKPDIVVSDNDLCSFELYLFRYSKKINAKIVCFQAGFLAGQMKEISNALILINSYLKTPKFIPFRFGKILFSKARKYFGHFLYYWFFPILTGQMPFFGKSSCLLWRGNMGMRDADYYIVYSEKDRKSVIKDGVLSSKVFILSHPLSRKSREIFEKAYFKKNRENFKKNSKIITIMWTPEEIGFRRKDLSLISKTEMQNSREEIISFTAKILKGWKIFIKPHPDTKNYQELGREFKKISNNIEVVNPLEPADKYIEISNVIAGFPPTDTAIFTSNLQCPEKPILFFDLLEEFLGNVYLDKTYTGIDYINSKEKLINVLEKINQGKYKKEKTAKERGDFENAAEVLEFVYNE